METAARAFWAKWHVHIHRVHLSRKRTVPSCSTTSIHFPGEQYASLRDNDDNHKRYSLVQISPNI